MQRMGREGPSNSFSLEMAASDIILRAESKKNVVSVHSFHFANMNLQKSGMESGKIRTCTFVQNSELWRGPVRLQTLF
jgi:replicative DNA helicase